MSRWRTTSFFAVLFVVSVCRADAADIGDRNDLQQNSSTTSWGYELNAGADYVVVAPVDISGGAPTGLVFSGDTLNVDATGMASTALVLESMRLDGGDTTAVGGTASGVYGVSGTALVVNDAGLRAVGGTAADTRGASFASVDQYSGTVAAMGDAAYNGVAGGETYGLFAGAYTVHRGAVAAEGGGDASVGMRVETQFTFAGPGSFFAEGGSGTASHGFQAERIVTQSETYAQIMATGGGGDGSYGIEAAALVLDSGYTYGYGGAGDDAHGIHAGAIDMSGGAQIHGAGGHDDGTTGSHGIDVGVLNQSGYSILSAVGGGADDANGVNAGSWTVSDPSVYVSAMGGGGDASSGVRVAGDFDFGGGTLYAFGGTGDGSSGVRVDGTAAQTNGWVDAYAGGAGGHGISAGVYLQRAGELRATGGPDGGHGLAARVYELDAGAVLTAEAGFSDYGYGVYAAEELTIAGRAELRRDSGMAASIHVDSTNAVTIAGTAVVAPVVYLNGNTYTDSGLLSTASGGRVVVESGATVDPWFIGGRDMHVGDAPVDYLFIDTGGGTIDGAFASSGGGMAIEYVLYKDAAGRYFISFGRVIETPDLIAMVPCDNARRLMSVFDDLYDAGDEAMVRVLSAIDHAANRTELVRIAAHVGRTLIPTAYAKLTGTQQRTIELVQDSVFRRLDYLTRRAGDNAAALPAARALANRFGAHRGAWTGWAEAVSLRSSRFKSHCVEFDAPTEKIRGVSTGVGRDFGSVAVAGAFAYARGSYASGYTDTGVDNFALTLGVKLHELVPAGGWFRPWISAVGGYAFADIEQKALNYPATAWKRSSPSAHMARLSVEAGNEFRFGPLALSAVAGIDYAHIRQGGYAEDDPAGYGLRVRAGGYDSLRPRLGVAADWRVGDGLSLGVNARYRYETLDKRSRFDYGRLSAPDVVLSAEGEKRKRFSGSVGAAVRYRAGGRVLLSGEYDLILEDGYAANRFSLGAAVEF